MPARAGGRSAPSGRGGPGTVLPLLRSPARSRGTGTPVSAAAACLRLRQRSTVPGQAGLLPPGDVGMAQGELAASAPARRDRAPGRLGQPSTQRRRCRCPRSRVRPAVLSPPLMMRAAHARQHRDPLAGRHLARRAAHHRIGRVGQDHRNRELRPQLRPQPDGQPRAPLASGLRGRGHAPPSAGHGSARIPAATSARRASSIPRWLYVSIVVLMLAWPSRRCTTSARTPRRSSPVA